MICGRLAGRLGAIFGAPRFTPGFPADGFGGTSVAVRAAGFGSGLAEGLAAGFAAGLAAGFATDFTPLWVAGLAAGFATLLATGLAAGFATLLVTGLAAGLVSVFGAGRSGNFAGTGAAGDLDGATFADAVFFCTGVFADVGARLVGAGDLKMRERSPFFSATSYQQLHKVGDATRVAPLVVIPGNYLRKRAVHDHGALCINNRRARIATEI